MAWLPHSIVDASVTEPPGGDVGLSEAWAHLLGKLEHAAQTVQSDPASRNAVDLASGMRHLLVLLATGADEALRLDPDPILSVQRASTNDIITWGMECPDCIYTRAALHGGESYRLFGNRGTARYVGLRPAYGTSGAASGSGATAARAGRGRGRRLRRIRIWRAGVGGTSNLPARRREPARNARLSPG